MMDYHGHSAKEQRNLVNRIKKNSNQLLTIARLNDGKVVILSDGQETIKDLRIQLKTLNIAKEQIITEIDNLVKLE